MQLLKNYSLRSIIQFVIILALAFKGGISFIEWGWPRIKNFVKRADDPKRIKYNLKQHGEQIDNIKTILDKMIVKIDTLIQSDKDDIKAYITREHHFFVYQKGWIDDYSLDCIQKRYSHYIIEGGNSFVQGLMTQIRALPKKPLDQT